jgi:hypothetical protein
MKKFDGILLEPLEIEFKETGEFSALLPGVVSGNLVLTINYNSDLIKLRKKVDNIKPIISLIDKTETNSLFEWTFNIEDNHQVPKYNVRPLINSMINVEGVSYSFDGDILHVILDRTKIAGEVVIDLEVIDRDGNYITYLTQTVPSLTSSSGDPGSSFEDTSKDDSPLMIGPLIAFLLIATYFRRLKKFKKFSG